MSVTSFHEVWEGRETVESVSPDGRGIRTHKRVYEVVVSAKTDRGMTILSYSSAPQLFAPHPDDFFSTVRKRTPSQDSKSWKLWYLTVEYSTETPEQNDPGDNPLAEPPERSARTVQESEVQLKDRDGNIILNKADCPYDPPVEVPRSRWVATFVRNQASFTHAVVTTYVDKVNSAAIGSFDAGTVKCTNIAAEQKFSKGVAYFRVTYEFMYNRNGWQPKIAELSYMVYASVDGDTLLIPATDGNGKATRHPVPIDVVGFQIASDNLPELAISTTWNVYEEVDFLQLGLPFR